MSLIFLETGHEVTCPLFFVFKVLTHLGYLFFTILKCLAHLLHLCFEFSDLGFIFFAKVLDIVDEYFKFFQVALLLVLFEQREISFKLLVVLVELLCQSESL